jgi:thioredoxin reductase (NADPH)
MSAGGQALLTESIENFPGFPGGILTQELTDRLSQQVKDLGIDIEPAEIKSIEAGDGFKLFSEENKIFEAKAIIVASGAQQKKLAVPGEEKFTGRGVSYCAICDAPLFRNKNIIVVGGGDKAVEEALYLRKFAKSVKLIHRRDKLRATKVLQERIINDKSVEIIWNAVVKEIQGKEKVQTVLIENVLSRKQEAVEVDGVFVCVGITPSTDFLKGIVKLDDAGFVVTDENMRASCDGIFACGDCRKRPLHQVITACGEAAVAAVSLSKYLDEGKA